MDDAGRRSGPGDADGDKQAAAEGTRLERLFPGGGGFHIREGLPIVGILAVARRRRSGLIVMGTEGRTGLRRLAQPSVAEAVVREATVPVLTYSRGPIRSVRSVLAPVNLEAHSLPGLVFAAQVAHALGAHSRP